MPSVKQGRVKSLGLKPGKFLNKMSNPIPGGPFQLSLAPNQSLLPIKSATRFQEDLQNSVWPLTSQYTNIILNPIPDGLLKLNL